MKRKNGTTWSQARLLAAVLLAFTALPTHHVIGSHRNSARDSLSMADDPNEFRLDLADNLRATVSSVGLSAKLLPPFGGDSGLSERILTVSVDFPFKRAGSIIGVDLDFPVVLDAIDATGKSVALLPIELGWHRYEALEYTEDFSKPTRTVTPPGVLVHLRFDPHQTVPSSLSIVKWYVHALCAENVIEVDVPFEASGEWIETEAIPDLEISIDRAESHVLVNSTGSRNTLYSYRTTVRSRSRLAVRGLNEEVRLDNPVPGYVVLGTRLLLSEGGCLMPVFQEVRGSVSGAGAYCYGRAECPSSSADHIRHIIAVHPDAVKLPFELTDIPVPSLQAAAK